MFGSHVTPEMRFAGYKILVVIRCLINPSGSVRRIWQLAEQDDHNYRKNSPEIVSCHHNSTRQRGIKVLLQNHSLTFRVGISSQGNIGKSIRDWCLKVIPSDRRMFSTPAEKDPPPCGIQDSSRLPEPRSMSGMVGRSCVCSHPWHA